MMLLIMLTGVIFGVIVIKETNEEGVVVNEIEKSRN